jgi:hypothetical protein
MGAGERLEEEEVLVFSGGAFCVNLPGGFSMIRFPKRTWFGAAKKKTVEKRSSESGGSAVSQEAGNLRVVNPHEPLEVQPTASWVVVAWVLALVFAWGLHTLFASLPPYAHEIAKNLKGFPTVWADWLLWGVERFLVFAAILSALVHTLWRFTTTYGLTDHEIVLKTWVPVRRVEMMSLSAVKRVGFTQGVLGYVLDYGRVEMDLGGASGWVVLHNCPKPEAFLKELQKRTSGRPS